MTKLIIGDMVIAPTMYIPNTRRVKRTWKERLQSKFFTKYKEVTNDIIISLGDNVGICSFQTYAKLQKQILNQGIPNDGK